MAAQRITALMQGRKPDRLPWVGELNHGFILSMVGGQYAGKNLASDAVADVKTGRSEEDYLDLERRCARKIGADHLHRVASVAIRRHRVAVETDPATGVTAIHTPAGDLRQVQQWAPNSGTVYTREHLIKGLESFPAYRAMMEDETYEPDYEAAEADLVRSDLATIEVPATPLMHLLLWVMDVQPTLMAVIEHRDEMVELMDLMHEKNKECYRLAAAGPGEVLRPMEDTSAMLTGPNLYAEHCLEKLNDYARIAHAAGKLFLPHMCGHLDRMLPVLEQVHLDGIEAITPAPLGDADLAKMRHRLGDVWLIGGVDPALYATATPDAMEKHVRKTLEAMRGDRKFMLGHEEIPVGARMENVRTVARLVEQTGEWFYA